MPCSATIARKPRSVVLEMKCVANDVITEIMIFIEMCESKESMLHKKLVVRVGV